MIFNEKLKYSFKANQLGPLSLTALTALLALLALFFLTQASPLMAQDDQPGQDILINKISDEIQSTTGLAITPGLTMLIRGTINNLRAEKGAELPWHSTWKFLLSLGLLLALFLGKDFIPFEPAQKFLMAGETGFMKLLGLLAFVSAVPDLSQSLSPALDSALNSLAPIIQSPIALASSDLTSSDLTSKALATTSEAGFSQLLLRPLASALSTIGGAVIFLAVWLVSNATNVLCLLAPGLAAPIIKGFRLTLVGLLTGLGLAHPFLGFLASLAVILICLMVMGWSFRLFIWGSLFSFDLIFRRWRHIDQEDLSSEGCPGLPAFAGALARKQIKVPKRTLGQLFFKNGQLFFTHKRFLFFKKTVAIQGNLVIGKTITAPILALQKPTGGYGQLFFFRLKQKGHEEYLKKQLRANSIENFGLLKGGLKAWAFIKSLFKSSDNLALELSPPGQA
ncbi:MAG: hypothetical protein LBE80_07540 [Deltaproteobacteria bacterium]|jgi:hypothetical protein|nr:hypothetical protein [Deltaproteobacteria bacterium]